MNGKAAKEHRRTARAGAAMAIHAALPALESLEKNELITRGRVDRLDAILARGLGGRLKWLLTGR